MVQALAILVASINLATVDVMVDEAFAIAGEERGEIRVEIVSADHEIMSVPGKRERVALAGYMPSGLDVLVVNRDAIGEDFEALVAHEVAHIIARRRYGDGIDEHGIEWRRICREVVQNRPRHYCKGH